MSRPRDNQLNSAVTPSIPIDSLILIAGFGSIGRRHFRNLRSMGFERFAFYRTHRGTVSADES
ncbi:MAG TPA: hypothetical protein VGH32_04475, partial [Pirellulales bacterium]